jgi:murein peptide amidase A
MLRSPIRSAAGLCAALLLALPAFASPSSSAITDAWCNDLGRRLHSVSVESCRAQHFLATDERTSGGRALVLRDIPATGKNTAKAPRVLVIGGIHGDELTSVSTVFRWLDWIAEARPAKYSWRIIPLANPDGLLIRPSTRANGRGVDLNRNFPTPDWDSDAQKYWTERTGRDPRRYPGDSCRLGNRNALAGKAI